MIDHRSARHPFEVISRWWWLVWLTPLVCFIGMVIFEIGGDAGRSAVGSIRLAPLIRPAHPPEPAEVENLIRSPSVLRRVVEENDLAALWAISGEEAAMRLRASIDHRRVGYGLTTEIAVTEIPGANSLRVWETLSSGVIAESDRISSEEVAEQLAPLEAEVGLIEKETNLARDVLSRELRGLPQHSPLVYAPSASRSHFESRQRDLEKAKLKLLRTQMENKVRENPVRLMKSPEWRSAPLLDRIEAPRNALLPALLGGGALAILLAYALEALVPGRKPDQAPSP
ncbi:hypothetical protein OJ996_18310 [Luteolibacter sp. GHJ8]|uniref:Subunit length determinant protein n=1 Tax=Luteolibacter rhizosphaerae TaxID=2989719 RepID=A0ABT3G6R8_9BACT|nr:hypothetical protein [Luteolibacter rhizosphaerae]MCW1915546.1 hypothetical protein [Luteolibacter rhizosphaerae]